MSQTSDIYVNKPISIWNRDLSFKPKDFIFSLGKAAVSGVFKDAKGVSENVWESLKSFGIEEKPAYATWVLIYKSLEATLEDLIVEHKDFFSDSVEDAVLNELASELEQALDNIEVGIDVRFFDQPGKLPLLDDIKGPLEAWLISIGMTHEQAESLLLRLKHRFVLSLHQEWQNNSGEYACIEKAINTPFTRAAREERGWMQYNARLQELPSEQMFGEAFSLEQVYIPLRAYYERKKDDGKVDEEIGRRNAKDLKRVVANLHADMEAWVRNFNSECPIRVISGGPGSGKSSFGKMFAAFVAREIEEVPVMFIPLHHFDLSGDLISAVEQFVRQDRYLNSNPLDASEGKNRLLIIFDGLDELSEQGKAAAETADFFMEEVIRKIDRFNTQGLQRQVLVTGRDLAVQSVAGKLRKEAQVLHVLPYFVPEEEAEDFVDAQGLLKTDQRNMWWTQYGRLKGHAYDGLPEKLAMEQLTPITREPLLNYLVALSFEREKIDFTDQTTLNAVYKDLLYAVHERQWDHGRHLGSKSLEIQQFIRILEEIALAVWHGNGRTATVDEIHDRCKRSSLTRHLEKFQEGAKKGVTRLLTAFYFRQSGEHQNGDKTFEFTHKSFGEYLTARRIVRLVKQIHRELESHGEDPDCGYDEKEALKRWAELCGPTAMDEYLFRFLCDEIAAHPKELAAWQKTFGRLVGYAVRNGVPMEELSSVTRFKEMMRFSRNAEEGLMVIHYACARVTQKSVDIDWGENKASFGAWIKRLQGQRSGPDNRLILQCLICLDISGCYLYFSDFYGAFLRRTNLQGVHFYDANLECTDLRDAKLQGANLLSAKLQGAKLQSAKLQSANLQSAYLERTDLRDANLQGTNLLDAKLQGAKLRGANLRDADLRDADLQGAELLGAKLQGANLRGANLRDADLRDADLQGADFQDAKLEGTDLIMQ